MFPRSNEKARLACFTGSPGRGQPHTCLASHFVHIYENWSNCCGFAIVVIVCHSSAWCTHGGVSNQKHATPLTALWPMKFDCWRSPNKYIIYKYRSCLPSILYSSFVLALESVCVNPRLIVYSACWARFNSVSGTSCLENARKYNRIRRIAQLDNWYWQSNDSRRLNGNAFICVKVCFALLWLNMRGLLPYGDGEWLKGLGG